MNSDLLTPQTKSYLVSLQEKKLSNEAMVQDLITHGWKSTDAAIVVEEFTKFAVLQNENKPSFIKRNPILAILAIVALVIVLTFVVIALLV